VPVRNPLWTIITVGVLVLAFIVLAPVLGFLLLILVAALAVGVLLFFGAPLLARLPWFRDRIHVEQHGGMRSVRFGPSAQRDPSPRSPLSDDVIDVEGREISGGDQF
jgi:hypothetical protein